MEIQKELCAWFRKHHRHLSFRESKDPYSIWVSEIMAQQTRIETMLPYYERWMKDYPTIEKLAKAPLEKVLKSWEGLGYYNRARKLHEGAQQVMKEYHGQLPKNKEELMNISGIGPYTAGAIASIAFDLPAAAVDGNVLRVISRLMEIDDDISKPTTVKKISAIVEQLMVGSNPSDFTQGLMELGALVCMPKEALCTICPLMKKCQSYAQETQMKYPIKAKKKPSPVYHYVTLLVQMNHKLLLSTNDQDGLMKGFYRMPQYESFDTEGYVYKKSYQHVYSHKIWKMDVYEWKDGQLPCDEKLIWVDEAQFLKLPMIGAHLKILREMKGEGDEKKIRIK